MTTVRVSVDIEVLQGDAEEIQEVVSNNLASVLGYVSDVIVQEGVEVSTKLSKSGAEVHEHDQSGSYCNRCVDQAQRTLFSVQ